ncbi:protein unc-79 homolog isoform X11 [Wyeomyia smithii]|uniref:protein unc-79 homolog isoform X11 n=1 Tax=Wyeomyia smithii TaxID=174621 RepID=UPI0024681BA1|nr:protein unc-79 homolog isoform X11 [Wyeomyia smithii]
MTGSFRVQLVNMGTRGAAFQAKLRCLHEYHVRLLSNQIPAPSGSDIGNTIKYFSQTLLTVLKDVPCSPLEMIKDPSLDQARMSSYPNLEYQNLYNALTMLLDVASNIQSGLTLFGKAFLQSLGCILPFLDKDLIDNLPYLTASCISVLPSSLHQDIINYLCYYILPFTITRQSDDDQECHACQSVSAVIMLVFQYSNNPAHHCQLLESLMRLKHNVVKDLLCVIAYGTSASRASAAKLLFYYWPAFDPNLFDRKGLLCKFTNNLIPFVCQRESCPNAGNAEAVKVCYNHCISILYAVDSPPPLYLCIECANEIHRDHPDLSFGDILHPMQQVSMICENKNCRSTDKSAVSICFSSECASYNGNHPIRYCAQCHGNRHNSRRGIDHIVHRSLPPMMMMDAEMQTYMVEAVISLLREAKPLNMDFGRDLSNETKMNASNGTQDTLTLEDRQLLGRYGIWLLVGRCKPTTDTPVEILGRLLSMLFHWFHITAYSYDGQAESTLEKLKLDHVCGWLKDVCSSHYKEFIDCLLPHPPEYARVGGHWDTLASRTSHLKEGLQRLICLIPYEIITQQIWDTVMPHWMEAITNDVPEKELPELKIVLSKILDPDMSPLGFDAEAMYSFVTIRFEKTTAKVQQQALHWLQNLTKLEILIPLQQLFSMFGDGVRIMKHGMQTDFHKDRDGKTGSGSKLAKEKEGPTTRRSSISPVKEDDSGNTSAISDDEAPISRHTEFSTDAEHNLTCCILMLDILLKQMELQEIEQHSGIYTTVSESVCRLLKCMVTAAKVGLGSHICLSKECGYCEASVMWHQMSTKLVQYLAPLNPVRPPDPPLVEVIEDEKPSRKSPPESEKDNKNRDRDVSLSMAPLPIPLGPLVVPSLLDDVGKIIIMAGPVPVAVPQPEPHSVGGVLVHMPHVCSIPERGREKDISQFIHATDEIMTATVETVSEQLDLAAIIPSEKVVTAVARSVTLSDADVATATVQIAKPTIVGETYQDLKDCDDTDTHRDLDDRDNFWHTSVGKFKFSIDNLPQSLQYIYQLLKEIPTIEKPDILYYILQCLKIMVLHGDAFTKAARDDRGFFIWCQENLLIRNLWEVCNADHSHICEVAVPTLLHTITLPLGSDVFWNVVQDAFHDNDWRVRFQAVERVTVITRFLDSTPLRSEVGLQASLATAFCHLIAACDDLNVHVAQRATLYLGTIHDKAIQALLFCLESQFDMFIVDRPVVLQSVYQLHNMLSDRKVLTWDFFLNRFDTLFVEAQVNLEKNGDISHLRDLRNSENGSEILSTKINKAREALSQSDTSGSMSKTLSASFGTKWPYKRTMSAPATIIPRQESKIEKEKVYNRQISAPILKRKSSRFGLDGHIHSIGGHGDEFNVSGCLYRIIDLEESDKETIHLLVFLLMQFMSRADLAYPTDEKPMVKQQSIVLRHLYLLLGYNQTEKIFHIPPTRLRTSAVFNSFMANLPQVLDQNHLMGWILLSTVIQVLLYAPNQGNGLLQSGTESMPSIAYTFSLWYMESHIRRNWMMSLLVILYKYQYNQPPYADHIQNLIRIIINSLDSHFHQCKRIPATVVMDIPATRSRDLSQPSLGTEDDKLQDTPPPSPIIPPEGQPPSHGHSSKHKTQKANSLGYRKYPDSSLEADDTESELVAIPESDLSDSTLQGSSAPGSFDDTVHFDDICAPLKPEQVKNKITVHVTTANLATAQVAISTITTGEKDDKTELSKKLHKIISSSSGNEKSSDPATSGIVIHKTSPTTPVSKCSVQEGVRMMVTSSMLGQPKAQAILNPPANVQKAVVVTQDTATVINRQKDSAFTKAATGISSTQIPPESVRKKFFKSVITSLTDFSELNPTSPVQLLVETLNSKKTLPVDTLPVILRNLSEYLQCVSIDSIGGNVWSTAVQGIDSLFRRIVFILPSLDEADNLLHIMTSILKVPQLSKNVLEPFSKILSYGIQNLTLTHKVLVDLCYLNIRAFSKERDKLQLCRQMVFELVQALKFKTNIPDCNLLLLVGILLQDAGGSMPPGIIEDLPDTPRSYSCNIAECMRQTYLNDIMEFLADFHTLSKIKFLFTSRQNFKTGGLSTGLSEDTLGGVLKGAIAQYLALEMSRGNSRDNRTVSRYLPWLNNAPSSLQQGPKEFTDCVGHMRLLSWLLMGSLTHTALMSKRGGQIGQHGASVHYHLHHPVNTVSQPVPQESSCHIADHIQVIFAGFAEQSKTSVLHMSSLFHAFTLCQLWTVYLEQIACVAAPSTESHNITMGVLFEFWAKVTPCILQLVSHSKLSESVNLHFLSLLEALKETRSTILAKLLPLWTPVLSSNTQLSGTLHVRLQNCRDAVPNATDQDLHVSEALLKWLQRLQFKMGQIELQSSTATQFYSI